MPPRDIRPICDRLGCFERADVHVQSDLRQGTGEVRLCKGHAQHAIQELTRALVKLETRERVPA